MNDAFKYFQIAGIVLPLVQTVVKLVESFPNQTGEQKKAQALGFTKSVYTGLQSVAKIKEIEGVPFEAFESIISMLIDSVVSLFNLAGIFTSKKGG